MSTDKQKEATRRFSCGRAYEAISVIFDSLPARFTTSEVMGKSGLKGCGSMYSAISVLERAFRCNRTASGIWRKP